MLSWEEWSIWPVSHLNLQKWLLFNQLHSPVWPCPEGADLMWLHYPLPTILFTFYGTVRPYCCQKTHVCLWDLRAETPEYGSGWDTGKFRRLSRPLSIDKSTQGHVCTTWSFYTLWLPLTSTFTFSALDTRSIPIWFQIYLLIYLRFPSDLPHYTWFNLFLFLSNILSADQSKLTC